MSPVERRRGAGHTGRAVAVAVVGVVVALGVAFGVATLASRGDVDVRLGDDRFVIGNAQDVLDDISEQGAPLGFNDVARFQRPIWVDNRGDDPSTGWVALGAFVPDDPDCLVQYDDQDDVFVTAPDDERCEERASFPRSGDGLRRYPTEVVDGQLFIDLQDTDESTE